MANQEHLDTLGQGVSVWNAWREQHTSIQPDLSMADLRLAQLSRFNLSGADLTKADLSGADLSGVDLKSSDLTNTKLRGAHLKNAILAYASFSGADLSGADLSGANLSKAYLTEAFLQEANLIRADLHGTNLNGANLHGANLSEADLSGAFLQEADLIVANLSGANLRGAYLNEANLGRANLSGAYLGGANLRGAYLRGANLRGADLSGAYLGGANLHKADFSRADLHEADLSRATLVETNLTGATLSRCSIYGISAWNVELEGAKQDSLVITPSNEPIITVDNLKVAQFIYLLLNNQELRDVLNSVTERGVLLLGRFSDGGLEMLQAIAAKLRAMNYLPMLFDFDRPDNRDYTETVKTLVGLSRFVIVDLSGPSVPQELYATVPHFKIPFVPILQEGRQTYSMFLDLLEYPWVIKPIVEFVSKEHLMELLPSKVIEPAEEKFKERQALLNQLFNR